MVENCLDSRTDAADQAFAVCTTLLDRYGVLCREAFSSEAIKGGFSRYYPVLKAMEERGKLRRGYYVDTLGATQFAIPGVDDQLRQDKSEESEPLWLSVLDPVQPFGRILPWPDDFPIKPMRKVGCQALFEEGLLIAILQSCRSKLLVREFDDEAKQKQLLDTLIRGLQILPNRLGQKVVFIEQINGSSSHSYAGAEHFSRAGFSVVSSGVQIRITNDGYVASQSVAPASVRRY